MPQAAPSTPCTSTHPDFPNGTEVINNSARSRYFGQRGVVYGSGPSRGNSETSAVIYVRWPDGERFKYFPSRLALAPRPEAEYRVSHSNRNGRKVQVHEIPATARRGRPTIFERATVSAQTAGATTDE